MALNFCNNNSLSAITSIPAAISGGALNLISTTTVSSSSSAVNITSGIDSTYKLYIFKFLDIGPATDNSDFSFNGSIDGGSNYNTTMTTTAFRAKHGEDGSGGDLGYRTARDQAQGTSFQQLSEAVGADNDQCISGELHLFDPSNVTFVKHFISQAPATISNDNLEVLYVAGYHNTTSAINAVSFKFESGNIDSGVIKLYGVS